MVGQGSSRKMGSVGSRALRVINRLHRDESGQIIPLLFVVLVALMATGILLFQTGRAADLRAEAQTAADAAALAGGHTLEEQLMLVDGSTFAVNEAAVRAAAEDYAERNDAHLTSFDLDRYDVRVTVATVRTLGGEEPGASPDEDDDDSASAHAQARVTPLTGFNGFGAFGGLGAPLSGLAESLKDASRLAVRMGLTVTSTTGGVHVTNSFHYRGLAIDVSGSHAQMQAFFHEALDTYGQGNTIELFYDPIGYYIKYGQRVPGAIGGHGDHVHLALRGDAQPIGSEGGQERGGAAGSDTRPASDNGGGGSDGGGSDPGIRSGGGTCGDAGAAGDDPPGAGDDTDSGVRRPVGTAGAPSLADVRNTESIPAIVYAVGRAMGATPKHMLAAFEAAIVESGFRNLPDGDRDSLGVFQQRPSQGWGTPEQILNPFYAARKFFEGAQKVPQWGSAGQLAQRVQTSDFPERYDQVAVQAAGLIEQVESGERPVIRGGLGAIAPCGLSVLGGATVQLVAYEG
jgi:Putative Flp pilus-assembly TadE/G-like